MFGARRRPVTGQPPHSWKRPWRRELPEEFVLRWAFAFFLPRLYYRERWVSRLGGRGLALYVLVRTAERYTTFTWVLPRLRQGLGDRIRWRQELVEQLGREPSEEELRSYKHRRWREEHPEALARRD